VGRRARRAGTTIAKSILPAILKERTTISEHHNLKIAKTLLARSSDGTSPEDVATLFGADLDYEIQGDDGVLPWVGKKTGRSAMADFLKDMGAMTERIKFDIDDVMASDSRALVLGHLVTKIKATGKVIEATFALVLTIQGNEIVRFQMLEDSYATAVAAQP
jgi:ketosteroid isomerase-like protein